MKDEIKNIRYLKDYVYVKVNSELNDVAGFVTNERGERIELKLNPLWKPTEHARICAEVIAAPQELTSTEPIYEVYPGLPKPVQFRGHEKISEYNKTIPRSQRNDPSYQMRYVCGGYNPQYVTMKGVNPGVEVGDVVYFHYNELLDSDNFAWREDSGELVYRIHYSNLFCCVRSGEIYMLNNYVFVSEVTDVKDIEFDGRKVRGRMHGNLVLVDMESEKSKNLQKIGLLEHIGVGIGSDTRDVPRGSTIVFRPNSRFINKIEGKDYYTMKQQDLIGVVVDDDLQAIGDYVKIIPDPQKPSAATIIFDPNNPAQEFKPGEIFIFKNSVSLKKKITKFGTGTADGVKVMYEKGSYYHFIEEFGSVLVRKGDILGTFN